MPERGSSGWGMWAKGDGRDSITASGRIAVYHPSSDCAELDAIASGLTYLSESGYLLPSDRLVMVQSDNIVALGAVATALGAAERRHENGAAIHRRRKPLLPHHAAAIARNRTVTDAHNLCLTVRHVRGHTNGEGRQWVNRLCDRLARQGAVATTI